MVIKIKNKNEKWFIEIENECLITYNIEDFKKLLDNIIELKNKFGKLEDKDRYR